MGKCRSTPDSRRPAYVLFAQSVCIWLQDRDGLLRGAYSPLAYKVGEIVRFKGEELVVLPTGGMWNCSASLICNKEQRVTGHPRASPARVCVYDDCVPLGDVGDVCFKGIDGYLDTHMDLAWLGVVILFAGLPLVLGFPAAAACGLIPDPDYPERANYRWIFGPSMCGAWAAVVSEFVSFVVVTDAVLGTKGTVVPGGPCDGLAEGAVGDAAALEDLGFYASHFRRDSTFYKVADRIPLLLIAVFWTYYFWQILKGTTANYRWEDATYEKKSRRGSERGVGEAHASPLLPPPGLDSLPSPARVPPLVLSSAPRRPHISSPSAGHGVWAAGQSRAVPGGMRAATAPPEGAAAYGAPASQFLPPLPAAPSNYPPRHG
eukprot:TRINITY_DN829_c0_g1_i12.p1 TRINITY_DN829_c0_g1~~TRINITY_DN829_c0_g1_i12.p1  ORF type:complete len:375 (+),score=32.50 TRINITY_DN829_c0_g1_i12:284-1408(+)